MLVWLFIAIIFALVHFSLPSKDKIGYSISNVATYICIFVFMALRLDYGDGKAYHVVYNQIKNGVNTDWELLFVWLVKITPSFQFLVVITSLLYVVSISYMIEKELNDTQKLFAILIWVLHPYILMVDMSAIRQTVSLSIFIFALYFGKRNLAGYFIGIVLAYFFHKSAILLFPVVFVINRPVFNIKMRGFLFVSTVIMFVAKNPVVAFLEKIMGFLHLDSKNYLSYLHYGSNISVSAAILSFLFFLFYLFCSDVVCAKKGIFVNLSILAIVADIMQSIVQSMGRISMYFLPFWTISLPLLLLRTESRCIRVTLTKDYVIELDMQKQVIILFIIIFIWKMMNFLTEQYEYNLFLPGLI